jgi:hypothetical protein
MDTNKQPWGCGELEPLYIISWDVKCTITVEKSLAILQKDKCKTTNGLVIPPGQCACKRNEKFLQKS